MTETTYAGIEKEWGITLVDHDGQRRDDAATLFMKALQENSQYAPCSEGGIFTPNGARCYIDGEWFESTTPICTNPIDVCAYQQALRLMIRDLAAQIAETEPNVKRVSVTCANAFRDKTWAVHDNISIAGLKSSDQKAQKAIADAIIPLIAIAPLLSGGGGICSIGGMPQKSQRARFVGSLRGGTNTQWAMIDRTFFKANDRLHFVHGDGTRKPQSSYVRVGLLAAALALVANGERFDAFALSDPVQTYHQISRSLCIDTPVRLASCRTVSAWKYCRDLIQHIRDRADKLPAWAPKVLERARAIVDALVSPHPTTLGLMPDWWIVAQLFPPIAEQYELPWDPVEGFGPLHASAPSSATANQIRHAIEACESAFALYYDITAPFFDDEIAPLLDDERIITEEQVQRAALVPPADTCSAVVGDVVRRYHDGTASVSISWTRITVDGRECDLSNPGTTKPTWRPVPKTPPALRGVWNYDPSAGLTDHAQRLYDVGSFDDALERANLAVRRSRTPLARSRSLRVLAWIQRQRGFPEQAIAALDRIAPPFSSFYELNQRAMIWNCGISPPPQIENWLRAGERVIEAMKTRDPGTAAAYLGHKGWHLLKRGRSEALDILGEALDLGRRSHWKLRSRLLFQMAEACRIWSTTSRARAFLTEGVRLASTNSAQADLAFALVLRAKCDNDHRPAVDAVHICRRNNDRVGIARALVVLGRLWHPEYLRHPEYGPDTIAFELARLRSEIPALRASDRLGQIIARWDEFTGGEDLVPHSPDEFWFG